MPLEPANTIRMRLMQDLQRDYGLNPAQAAGIVGSLSVETGGFRTMEEGEPSNISSYYRPNDAVGGFGYAQWTGPRRRDFDQYVTSRGLDPFSYEANYGFLGTELAQPYWARELERVRSAGDARSAAQIFTGSEADGEGFLRPGTPHIQRRMDEATAAEVMFHTRGGYYNGYYGDPAISPPIYSPADPPARPGDLDYKEPTARPDIFNDINTMLPDTRGGMGYTPGGVLPGGGIPTPERPDGSFFGAGGYSSTIGPGSGSRYNINANDPLPAPVAPTPDPAWMGTPESRAANEAAGRVASAQALSDWRADQAYRAANNLVWNGREYVEGGTWDGRTYSLGGSLGPPAPGWVDARGGSNTGIGLTMNDGGAYVPNVGGVMPPLPPPTYNDGTQFVPANTLNGFEAPPPVAVPTPEWNTPSFGNPNIYSPYGTPNGGLAGSGGIGANGVPVGAIPGGGANPPLTVYPTYSYDY